MLATKYKQLIFYLIVFLLFNMTLSFYEKPFNLKKIPNLNQNVAPNLRKNGVKNLFRNLESNNETIEINEEGNKTYLIKPKINYIFILKEDLTHFFKSESDDIIIYNSSLNTFPRFCAFDKLKTPIYVNHSLENEIKLEIVSLKLKSNVFSLKADSPKISGIKPMKESQI